MKKYISMLACLVALCTLSSCLDEGDDRIEIKEVATKLVTTGNSTPSTFSCDVTGGINLKAEMGKTSSLEYGVIYGTNSTSLTYSNIYNTTAAVGYVTVNAVDSKTGEFTTTLTGLAPNTTYYYRTYARLGANGDYVERYGDVKNFKTNVYTGPTYEVSSTGSYRWTQTTTGTWRSGNVGHANTSSVMTVTFYHTAGQSFSFDWSVSSESSCDWLTCTLDGQQIVRQSGYYSSTYTKTFTSAGTSTLVCTYSKDGSVNSGNDCATITFKE